MHTEGKDPRESSMGPTVTEALANGGFRQHKAHLSNQTHLDFLHSQLLSTQARTQLLVKVEHYLLSDTGIDGVNKKLVTTVKDIVTTHQCIDDDDSLSPPPWTMEAMDANA